jgi:glycosyltransferase involved in cell wall biosynthesis
MHEKGPITYDVIIPFHNGVKFVQSAFLSVLIQTYQPQCVIFVDDHSTDATKELIKTLISEYSPKYPIHVLKSEKRGPSAARNLGINASKSEFIALLDVDDTWTPKKIENQVKLIKNQEILIHSGAKVIDSNLLTVTEIRPQGNLTFENILLNDYWITGGCSSVLINRKALITAGNFDENMYFSEDYDLWLRLSKIGKFKACKTMDVKLLKHPESATQKSLRNLQILEIKSLVYCHSKHKLLKSKNSNKVLQKYIKLHLSARIGQPIKLSKFIMMIILDKQIPLLSIFGSRREFLEFLLQTITQIILQKIKDTIYKIAIWIVRD